MQYLFRIKNFPYLTSNDPEIITVERMTSIWEHFAKTGNPLPENCELFDSVIWQPYTPQTTYYLEIGVNVTMKTNLRKERMDLWDHLFPLQNCKK